MPGLSGLVANNLGRTYGVSPGSASYGYLSRRMKSAGATNPYGIPTDFPLPPEAYPRGVPPPGYTTYTGPTGSAEVPNDSLPPAATGVRPGPAYPESTAMGGFRPTTYTGDPGAKINDDMDPTHGMGRIPGGIDIFGNYPNENGDWPEVRRALPVDNDSPYPDLSNAPTVTPEGYTDPGYTNPGYGVATSPYPLPGGFYQPKPSLFGGLLDRLLGRTRPPPNTLGSSYNPLTGKNWADNATNTGYPNLSNSDPTVLDANGYPIPGGGRGQPSGNWAQNASRPTAPWGFGPNYVDPRAANAAAFGLAAWNAGGWASNPRSGEGYDLAGRQQGRHNIGALAARFGMAGVRGGRSGAGSGRMPGTFQ